MEDSPTQAEQLRYLLETNNYLVLVANNGEEALEMAKEYLPTLIISDIMMPLLDGFQLCSSVKNIPFILLTSLSDPEDIMKGLESGADNFILKPYDDRYLLIRIKNLLTNFELRENEKFQLAMEVFFSGKFYTINSDKSQILDLLISTFENAVQQNKNLIQSQTELQILNENLEQKVSQRTAKLETEIIERKKIETELKENLQELEKRVSERTAELTRINERLKVEMEVRGKAELALDKRSEELGRVNGELKQFAYIASHDLQEPLRIIASYTKLLERRYKDKLDASANDYINYAVDGAKRMQNLIDDLLYYSRVGVDIKLKPVDLNKVLNVVVSNLQLLIEENDALINFYDLPTINSDSTQMTQLFQNLIGNSIKYKAKEPPVININVRQKETEWIFSFSDNGIGINQKDQERIFVLFQRLHGKGEYPGTGLGLAICKKIVENLGGHIWLESEAGKGATFFFSLPVNN